MVDSNKGKLILGKWQNEIKLVQIFNIGSNSLKFLKTMGKCTKGTTKNEQLIYLELFEAVYLVDIGELDLYVEETKMTVEDSLKLIQEEDKGFTLSHYYIYSYLKRSGLILTRSTDSIELPFYLNTIFNVYQSNTHFSKSNPGPPSYYLLVLHPDDLLINPSMMKMCLEFSDFTQIDFVVALTDYSLRQSFITIKCPKDINEVKHIKKKVNKNNHLLQNITV